MDYLTPSSGSKAARWMKFQLNIVSVKSESSGLVTVSQSHEIYLGLSEHERAEILKLSSKANSTV